MDKKEIGYRGETAACNYLIKKGYEIVARNFCIRGGEIDIIAKDKDYIVFVEVKTREENAIESGLYAITKRKQRLVINAAKEYLYKNPVDLQPRFDAAEVIASEGKPYKIKYIENAYDESTF